MPDLNAFPDQTKLSTFPDQTKLSTFPDQGIDFPDQNPVDTSDIEPLPEADVSPWALKESAKQVAATGELMLSLGMTSVLYPASKLSGALHVGLGGEEARQAEADVMQWVYQPSIESAKGALNWIGTGFEAYLTPSRMADEYLSQFDDRLGYLVGSAGELGQLAFLPKGGAKAKATYTKLKVSHQVRKAKKSGAKVMDLIKDRRGAIDSGILDSEIFIREVERNLTKEELDAVPFLREGIKDPDALSRIGREDLVDIVKDPSKELLKETNKVGNYYDEGYQFLKDNWGDIDFVEDYVTHLWDIPKKRKSEVVRHFALHNPFTKKRTIPTLETGIKLGLKPKTTNIADMLRVYDHYKIKTVHNMKFAESLKGVMNEEGLKVLQRADKAPADWVEYSHPALDRAMGRKVGKGKVLLEKVPVKVDPIIKPALDIIFSKPFSHPAVAMYQMLNAYTKKSMLSLSFFHHMALTESAFATGIGLKALKLWNPWEIKKQIKTGNFDIYRKQGLAKDAIENGGVTFGSLSDVQRGTVQKSLEWLERSTKDEFLLGKSTKLLRSANQLWDTTLWDYYHNNLKLYAYEANVSKALKSARGRYGRDLTPKEIKAVKFEMGKFVNDSFGGQNWELSKIMGNPKMRQLAHWIFLAPDWTLSTIKQATAPARGVIMAMQGKVGGVALAKRGGMFWAKSVLYFNILAQSANYYNTQKEYGKGRFTWDNPPGHTLNIFAGRNNDGTERYLRLGKQFREVMEWGAHPFKKLGQKLAPVLREGVKQLTGHTPSGYPSEWAKEDNFWKTLIPRAGSILEMPIPFSLRPYIEDKPTMFMFSLPASKGMTSYKAIKLFKKAITDKSMKNVKRIYFATLENNLDAESLFKIAKTSVKSDITYNDKKIAKDILSELEILEGQAKQDAYLFYDKRGVLTENVKKQMNKLLTQKRSIKQQKQQLGIKGN